MIMIAAITAGTALAMSVAMLFKTSIISTNVITNNLKVKRIFKSYVFNKYVCIYSYRKNCGITFWDRFLKLG